MYISGKACFGSCQTNHQRSYVSSIGTDGEIGGVESEWGLESE